MSPDISKLIGEYMLGMKPVVAWNTYLDREMTFKVFLKFLQGKAPLIERKRASNSVYAEWVAYACDRWAGSTAQKHTTTTGGFMNWLEANDHVKNNPHKCVKKPRVPSKPPRAPFTRDEYERLRRASTGSYINWAIIVAWDTGMAWIDVAMLQWSEVDLENLVIRKARQKTGTTCTIPITPGGDFHEGLLARKELISPLYPNDLPNGISYVDTTLVMVARAPQLRGTVHGSSIATVFRRFADRAGIDKSKSFHNFRATLLSHLANSYVPTVLACAISGHSDPAVFKKYVTPNDDAINRAMRQAMEYRDLKDGGGMIRVAEKPKKMEDAAA